MYYHFLFIIPVLNLFITFILGVINKANQSNPISLVSEFLNSNFVGDLWLIFFIINIITCIVSAIHANCGENKNSDYQLVWIACAASIVLTLVIIMMDF